MRIDRIVAGTICTTIALVISVSAALGTYASHSAIDVFDGPALGHALGCGIPLAFVTLLLTLSCADCFLRVHNYNNSDRTFSGGMYETCLDRM